MKIDKLIFTILRYLYECSDASTSTDVYDETMDIQIVIESKNGADMRAYNPSENEILFKRGTLSFVTKRKGNRIWMTEV